MKRPSLKKAVLVVLSVGLVVYLLRRIDPADVLKTLASFPPLYLAGGFLLFIAGHFMRAVRMRALLSRRAPIAGLFKVMAVQTAAVGFLPMRTGELSLFYLLKSGHGIDYADSAAVLMLAKALDFLVVVTLFVASAGVLPVVPDYYSDLLPWAGGLFFVVAAAIFLMGRASGIYARLPGFLRRGRLMEGLEKVARGVEIIRSRRLLAETFVLSLVLWILLYAANFVIIRGVGLHLGFAEMAFLTTSMTLFMNLPVHAPGGLGTAESLWAAVVYTMGVPAETGIATGFASHIVSYVYTLGFMLYGLGLLRSRREG